MNTSPKETTDRLLSGVGRRTFLQAVLALGGGAALSACSTPPGSASSSISGVSNASSNAPSASVPRFSGTVLNPGVGDIPGDHYLESTPDSVLWGYVPGVDSTPTLQIRSGQTVTVDTVSHEGILEDQGRDPDTFFGQHGVNQDQILDDARAIAAEYDRTPRDFDTDGPHVVTGPVFVEDAHPGDVLKIETLRTDLRVPYGVVSSRHGKGALGIQADGHAPDGITLDEVMPPIGADNRDAGIPSAAGNVSVFTAVDGDRGVMDGGSRSIRFPLRPFMGMMGVARESGSPADPVLNSIPPTLGGGNIDVRALAVGSAFYLPINTEGALFYTGDPHMGMGDGEVALTAMEGSLRTTFRLTVCKEGSGDAPSVAFRYPFGETEDHWVPIGLSDPDGSIDGQGSDLDIAMRRAVINALDFLEQDLGVTRMVAYAYLSAAADFAISQTVDRTTGVHGMIRKADFS